MEKQRAQRGLGSRGKHLRKRLLSTQARDKSKKLWLRKAIVSDLKGGVGGLQESCFGEAVGLAIMKPD